MNVRQGDGSEPGLEEVVIEGHAKLIKDQTHMVSDLEPLDKMDAMPRKRKRSTNRGTEQRIDSIRRLTVDTQDLVS